MALEPRVDTCADAIAAFHCGIGFRRVSRVLLFYQQLECPRHEYDTASSIGGRGHTLKINMYISRTYWLVVQTLTNGPIVIRR